ncbi:hypothetical protein AB6G04_07665 [Proteus mirabilis]|uniref:hypothetical protein n=1 Tax=Proteus mirabilis TaxID=584 RepID=UPI0034DD8964
MVNLKVRLFYSLVEQLNDKESITISQYNDIRAFFGISAFHLSQNIGVSAFLLANFAKTHALTISKNKQDEVVFSFVNKMDAGLLGLICWDYEQ